MLVRGPDCEKQLRFAVLLVTPGLKPSSRSSHRRGYPPLLSLPIWKVAVCQGQSLSPHLHWVIKFPACVRPRLLVEELPGGRGWPQRRLERLARFGEPLRASEGIETLSPGRWKTTEEH